MSEYQQFLQERDRIDFLLQNEYKIKKITENLSGAFVEFEKKKHHKDESEYATIHITTPEARKYFSVILIKQQKEDA
ncbi:hypothetical protein [Bacillus cihuensis]|uniref:hypothetical protein n=1 Tax=Bacillus cihuensis TaxID=1208599 RepID=UPI00041A09B7|nr:hypothetical protein [Bacillus cihuensis]